MAEIEPPEGLSAGGEALWRSVTAGETLDGSQTVLLTEACRAKDRLDQLDLLLRADIDAWAKIKHFPQFDTFELKIDGALSAANATAGQLRQILNALNPGQAPAAPAEKPKSPLDLVKEQVDELARRRSQSGT